MPPPPPRNNNKKKKRKKNSREHQKPKKPAAENNFSVDELTEAGVVALANQEVETAVALYTAALDAQSKLHKDNAKDGKFAFAEQRAGILEKRAEAKTILGDPDGAREDYQQALELHKSTETLESSPSWYEQTASLYLYIGQTSAGRDALAAYEQALSILETCKTQCSTNHSMVSDPNVILELTQQLSSTCCNAAEVFLTDLCEEPDAEEQCEKWVQKALTYQIPSTTTTTTTPPTQQQPTIDALQLLANLRISQCRPAEAIPPILQAYQQIEEPCRSLARLVDLCPNLEETSMQDEDGEDQAKELLHDDLVQSLPGFEFRCQMVKIMLEAASVAESVDEATRTHCRKSAITVLGSLMAENDEVIEIWSLLGDAFASIGSNDEAASYWQGAADMLSQLKKSIEDDMQASSAMQDEDDDDGQAEQREEEMQHQLDDVMCQLDDIRRKLSEIETNEEEDGEEAMQE